MKLKAIGYNAKGDAITKYNNKIFYVRGLIFGEVAQCSLIIEKEKWGIAKIERILTLSNNRNHDVRENHLLIGGYELLHMNYDEQIRFKESKIKDDFQRNANEIINLSETFKPVKKLRYRNKITLHDGAFYKRGSKEKIYLDDFLLTDIIPTTNLDGDVIIRKLDDQIIGKKGSKGIFTTHSMMCLKFKIDLNAFYQVHIEVAKAAYSEILNYLPKDSIVFDLFSGIGTISLLASKRAKKVYGVEWNKYSHLNAVENRKINNINNVLFFNEDVFKFVKRTKIKPDIIIVDPARDGLKKKTCEMLLEIMPNRIIYLSCNPGTQAADFNRLKKHYQIVHARAFDMFPQSYHIENLIIIDKIS